MGLLSGKQSMGVAALLLSACFLLSRLMGLVRDKVISWQFGAGGESDIYFAAFVVPDIINYLMAGGFLGITLMPLLARRFAEDEADAWKFFSTVLSWMGVAALALISLAWLFAEPLAHVVAPGLEGPASGRLAFFIRLQLPAQFFFLTGSCITALLFLRRQFVIPALTPLIYNGCILLFGISLPLLGLVQGMTGYCVGVVAGAALGAFFLPLRTARQQGFPYAPSFRHPLFRRFLLLALPLMLGQTITALDEQFLRVFGSLMGEGAVSLLNYAKRLAMVPIALVVRAAAISSFPFLVALLARGEKEEFFRTLARALRVSVGLIVPLALWMAFLAPSAFTLIFYGGRMTGADVLRAVPLLQILLCATPFWVLVDLLSRGYYAQTDTLTPAVAGTLVTIIFVPVYAFVAVPLGPWAMTAASTTGIGCYALTLTVIWLRRHGAAVFTGLVSTTLRSAACALPGSVLGCLLDAKVREALAGHSPYLAAFAGFALAGTVFLLTFVPLGMRFCPELFARLTERLRRKKDA